MRTALPGSRAEPEGEPGVREAGQAIRHRAFGHKKWPRAVCKKTQGEAQPNLRTGARARRPRDWPVDQTTDARGNHRLLAKDRAPARAGDMTGEGLAVNWFKKSSLPDAAELSSSAAVGVSLRLLARPSSSRRRGRRDCEKSQRATADGYPLQQLRRSRGGIGPNSIPADAAGREIPP